LVSTIYFGRVLFGTAPQQDFLEYVLYWLRADSHGTTTFWVAFLIWFLVSLCAHVLVFAGLTKQIANTKNDFYVLTLILIWATITLAIACVTFLGFLFFFGLGGYGLPIISVLITVIAAVPTLIATTILLSLVIRLVVGLMLQIATRVFDAATRPETSPFTYFAGLIGIVGLVFATFKALTLP